MGASIHPRVRFAGDTWALCVAGTLFISCDEHQTQVADDRYFREAVAGRRSAIAIIRPP
jgi:hypothetical protein